MILEFVDGSSIDVIAIFGSPVNINGTMRDVLTIDIDPNTISQNKLREIFNNTNNLAHLYTYEDEVNENDEIVTSKIEIGEGYTILLNVEKETRKVEKFPGKITPDEFTSVLVVTIAQMTYDEWIASGYASNS